MKRTQGATDTEIWKLSDVKMIRAGVVKIRESTKFNEKKKASRFANHLHRHLRAIENEDEIKKKTKKNVSRDDVKIDFMQRFFHSATFAPIHPMRRLTLLHFSPKTALHNTDTRIKLYLFFFFCSNALTNRVRNNICRTVSFLATMPSSTLVFFSHPNVFAYRFPEKEKKNLQIFCGH